MGFLQQIYTLTILLQYYFFSHTNNTFFLHFFLYHFTFASAVQTLLMTISLSARANLVNEDGSFGMMSKSLLNSKSVFSSTFITNLQRQRTFKKICIQIIIPSLKVLLKSRFKDFDLSKLHQI